MKTHDQIEGRGLAGAVRADQGQRLVLSDGERDILNGAQAAETFVEILDHQCVGHGQNFAGFARRCA